MRAWRRADARIDSRNRPSTNPCDGQGRAPRPRARARSPTNRRDACAADAGPERRLGGLSDPPERHATTSPTPGWSIRGRPDDNRRHRHRRRPIAEVFEGDRPGLDCGGRCLAPGIIDIGVKVGEPGERHKESFRTAGAAAAAGGVTTIVTRPDTRPAIDTPETLEFLHRRAVEASPVNVLPMAALTKGREGREMTEIGFLLDAGAVAFTDAAAIANARVLERCLTYAAGLGALVIGHPQDPALGEGACMTTGQFASQLGLPAVSPVAERIGLERDLALAEATGARYHADQLSTAAALASLARAKAAGLAVTAGASIHHLTLNELDVGDYRTFFKLTPPLRSEDDRMALVAALADGLIDVVGSFHTPQDEEEKRLRGGRERRRRARDAAAGRDAARPCRRRLPAGALARPRPQPGAPARARRRPAGAGRPGRPRALRPGHALRPRPLHAALEVEEHPLRPAPDAGPGAAHLGRRARGLRAKTE